MMGILDKQEKRVQEEMKSYTAHDVSARKKNYRYVNPFLHRYTFIARVNSLDPDQPALPCHLIRI
jgi:hypothetical protein